MFAQSLFNAFEHLILNNGWFCWSVLPFTVVNVGLWSMTLLLETARQRGRSKRITYGNRRRSSMMAEFHRENISYHDLCFKAIWKFSGPPFILGSLLRKVLFVGVLRLPPPETALPDLITFGRDFVLMELLMDFILYWFHRLQHSNDFLWQFHKVHHEVSTPSAVSGFHTSKFEDTLGASVVALASGIIIRPHPVTYSVSIAAFLVDIGPNLHCGLDAWWIDVLTLRFLPFRGSIAHHDHHHHYSNYKGKSKNLGNMFSLWDWAFGTLAKTKDMADSNEAIDKSN